jgi:hypothetical protein
MGCLMTRCGLGPAGYEVSMGLLARVFPDELVVAAIEETGTREKRSRALPLG